MDTKNDGVIDDPLVIKRRVGRPSLGLTKDEMKERRETQRKARKYKKDLEKRTADITNLVNYIFKLNIGYDAKEIIDIIVEDTRWKIDFKSGN